MYARSLPLPCARRREQRFVYAYGMSASRLSMDPYTAGSSSFSHILCLAAMQHTTVTPLFNEQYTLVCVTCIALVTSKSGLLCQLCQAGACVNCCRELTTLSSQHACRTGCCNQPQRRIHPSDLACCAARPDHRCTAAATRNCRREGAAPTLQPCTHKPAFMAGTLTRRSN